MYSRPEQLLEQYPVTVKSVSKGRDCHLCDTNLGMLALHEYHGSKERAAFLAKMLKHLKENKVLTECIIESDEGEVLILDEEEKKYLLTENYHGAECDTRRKEDMVAAVVVLARFHNAAKNYAEEIPEMILRNQNSLLELYEKHNRELRQIRNYIRTRKKKNAFEALFMQKYEEFHKKAVMVSEALSRIQLKEEMYGFCHGDYNQHSILFAREGVAIVGLERFTYDLQIRDLANFVRKMMEKNNWDIELGKALINAYKEVRVLDEEEEKYLYFFLAYPEKFWKLANHYNSTHKSWISERSVEKLEKIILQEKQREDFLSSLFLKNQLY